MWYSDVVYIYMCVCYVGNLMVWMDFFVMASELGCSKLFVVPCFLGGKKQSLKNRWTNWWFDHCYSSLLWNSCSLFRDYGKNMWQFVGILVVVDELVCSGFGVEMLLLVVLPWLRKTWKHQWRKNIPKNLKEPCAYSITCFIFFPVWFHLFPNKEGNIPIPKP